MSEEEGGRKLEIADIPSDCDERPPRGHEEILKAAEDFIEENVAKQRRIVLVTSGGTTVPLEKNTVRFMDNFSAGTRGANSVEAFIQEGYAVVFLHRETSLFPYTWRFQRPLRHFMRYLSVEEGGEGGEGGGRLVFDSEKMGEETAGDLMEVVGRYKAAMADNVLFTVDFTSIQDYLFYLKHLCTRVGRVGERGMVYLAAAVADFFLPYSDMADHKIQSRAGPLTLTLQQTPKVLGTLRQEWCPNAFVVSFKLETDETILIKKATTSLEKYGVDCVVANLLHTRMDRVILVEEEGEEKIDRLEAEGGPYAEVEGLLVNALANRHSVYIAEAAAAAE